MQNAPRFDEDAGWSLLEVLSFDHSSYRAMVERNQNHGFFRYCVERYFGPAEEDEGLWPDGFWQVEYRSGLFDTIDHTVKEAKADLETRYVSDF